MEKEIEGETEIQDCEDCSSKCESHQEGRRKGKIRSRLNPPQALAEAIVTGDQERKILL